VKRCVDELAGASLIAIAYPGERGRQIRKHYISGAAEGLRNELDRCFFGDVSLNHQHVRREDRGEVTKIDADDPSPVPDPSSRDLQPATGPTAEVENAISCLQKPTIEILELECRTGAQSLRLGLAVETILSLVRQRANPIENASPCLLPRPPYDGLMSRDDEEDGDSQPFNAPFRHLGKLVGPLPNPVRRVEPKPRSAPKSAAPRPSPSAGDDLDLFEAAVRGVVPIPANERRRVAPARPPAASSAVRRDEDAALAELADLVAGVAAFDISDTEEHVEGTVVGLDPRILRRLRAGEFAYQGHLDLHGMIADEAKSAVQEFVFRSMVPGHRCVLLVHGRGRNSPDQRPVLKDRLKDWLTHGEIGRRVLAFSTARPYDGGSGAMYVLLRRERRDKRHFRTLVGAKS
jgi:DNA-nicking Smr family endonuclease